MRVVLRLLGVPFVLLILSLGCFGSDGIDRVVGTYALAAIDDAGPPFVLSDRTDEDGLRHTVLLADTLTFFSDSSVWNAQYRYVVTTLPGFPPDTRPSTGVRKTGRFHLSDGAILAIWPISDGEDTEVMHFSDDGAVLRSSMFNRWCPDGCPEFQDVVLTLRRVEE